MNKMAKHKATQEALSTQALLQCLSAFRSNKNYSQVLTVLDLKNYVAEKDLIFSEDLTNLLSQLQLDARLLYSDNGRGAIQLSTLQFIVIDHILSETILNDIRSLREIAKDIQARFDYLFNWRDFVKFIICADYFNHCPWRTLVDSSELDWTDIIPLNSAMLDSQVAIEDICIFLERVIVKHPNDGALSSLGKAIDEKLKGSIELISTLPTHLDRIITNENLNRFLPGFICGFAEGHEERFDSLFNQLKDLYQGNELHNVLYALGVACPVSRYKIYDEMVLEKFNLGNISRQHYLALNAMRKNSALEVIALLDNSLEVGFTEDDQFAVCNYLYDLSGASYEEWYVNSALKLFRTGNEKLHHRINFLLYEIAQKNLPLAYRLLGERFAMLGNKHLLEEYLVQIIEMDIKLFQYHLTQWLNSDSHKVHAALLKICSGQLPSEYCQISAEYFNQLHTKDKVYICIKIAGYIYSMEHLQTLLFSVLEHTAGDDRPLLTNLYSLFKKYLIYNYRSTLDQIRERVKTENIEPNHRKFLQSLVDYYDHYFEQLNLIRNFHELQCDSRLSEYLRFYQQQQFSDSMNNIDDDSFLKMLTPVSIHSARWAIRRKTEKKHDVQPLGLIQHSMEFPSGEKLDPTGQEATRRTYQKMKKDEINFS